MAFKRKPCLRFFILFLQLLFWNTNADVYMHNPRGSNNRFNERTANRRNANRLFDSQNNNNGGYNVGDRAHNGNTGRENDQYGMEYFMSGPAAASSERKGKSILTVEWTNQHGCGDDDLNCNIVLQYKCQDATDRSNSRLRNGLHTGTPPEMRNDARTGLHESMESYRKCKSRTRNTGLFVADQKLTGRTSRHTRQNPQGKRYGYECPEERDYYPYWHPSEWVDETVYVKREEDCAYYTEKSFNREMKGECLESIRNRRERSKWNNYWDCTGAGGKWIEFSSYLKILEDIKSEADCYGKAKRENPIFAVRWAIPYIPERETSVYQNPARAKHCLLLPPLVNCKLAPTSRANHLGNGEGVTALRHQWILPYVPGNQPLRCVYRIRYNISTDDYNVSSTFAASNERKVHNYYLVNQSPIVNNPTVEVGQSDIDLQLAINTAQFGRTFQDRSHVFYLIPRPSNLMDSIIHNINVRGKRGNIVQVYPAVEYDFIPKRETINTNDLVHFQWTGSNTNPHNFAGEGKAGTDRSNVVEMIAPDVSIPMSSPYQIIQTANVVHSWGMNEKTKTSKDLGVMMASSCMYTTADALFSPNNRIPSERDRNRYKAFAQLDYAPPSCSLPLFRLPPGRYYYMSTRNNNFSNRSQKGRLTVQN